MGRTGLGPQGSATCPLLTEMECLLNEKGAQVPYWDTDHPQEERVHPFWATGRHAILILSR